MLFVSIAHAADTAAPAMAPGGPAGLMQFAPLVLILVVFYFLLIRPQQKKMKDHQKMVTELAKGDRVITNGGLIGTIHKINSDTELTIEIADGVRVRVVRGMITAKMEVDGTLSGDPQGLVNQGDDKKAA